MRATIEIDDDVLLAATAIAEEYKCPLGEVISDLARRSLQQQTSGKRNGIPLLVPRPDAPLVTHETVKGLCEIS
ncbi:CopG family transcriptional regulator [Chelativorans xinjiangense]|uniref:CopG family transcriptional regulator n=1 Tax=Chelativorans xinjiangense TaxID=2681485 RepID=UPI00135A0442|nr:CopG family transcriptional regulator [Chelativorans xinjiangense]